MELYRFSIPKDDVWRVTEEIGNRHFAHFIDLNKNAQTHTLPFGFRVKQCDETERRIGYLLGKSVEYKVPIIKPNGVEQLDRYIVDLARERECSTTLLFENIERDVREKEKFVQEQLEQI
jgi:hypothetical protein